MYLQKTDVTLNGKRILFLDLNIAIEAIVKMIETELPPGLKFDNIEDNIACLNERHNPYVRFEFERSFGVAVDLTIELKRDNYKETFTSGDWTYEPYKLRVEIGAHGTNYNVIQAASLHALQGRVIEFATNIECMFDYYPIYRVRPTRIVE